MQINQVQTVYQLAFLPRIFPVNCYFVEEENSLTLIDTALPFSWKGIINAADSIGKPIEKIILTHAHGDHVGALDTLKKYLPDVPVYISKRDARLMHGDTSIEETEPQTPIRGGVPKNPQTSPDILLHEGDEVGSLIAISTPGHTPGSMSFIDQRTNTLIAGDAFQTRGGIAVAGQVRLTFPFPAFGTWNKELALASAKKLLNYNPTLLAIGHGKMLINPEDEIKRAIETAELNVQITQERKK